MHELSGTGTREDWEALLPVIQAFVEGKQIQRLSYTQRWEDTTRLHGLLTGAKYRIKPDSVINGVWSAQFNYTQSGFHWERYAHGVATLQWEGSNQDTPVWPDNERWKMVEGTLRFTPSLLAEPAEDPENVEQLILFGVNGVEYSVPMSTYTDGVEYITLPNGDCHMIEGWRESMPPQPMLKRDYKMINHFSSVEAKVVKK